MVKLIDFIRYKWKDYKEAKKNGLVFSEYGLTLFCGRQGAGKTMAMTEYLERMRKKYPKVKIYTNYGYKHEDGPITNWRDIVTIRNGLDGVIFAIDEIQNEWSSEKWRDFPEFLLSEITQQRKQRIKIVGTSQVFSRVVKQLREQCYEVVECFTFAGRWTFTKAFDAEEYNFVLDNPEKKMKLRRLWRHNFIQTDELRALYDSYARIERLGREKFIPRNERAGT